MDILVFGLTVVLLVVLIVACLLPVGGRIGTARTPTTWTPTTWTRTTWATAPRRTTLCRPRPALACCSPRMARDQVAAEKACRALQFERGDPPMGPGLACPLRDDQAHRPPRVAGGQAPL
jgi:hypothetical protein